MAQTSNLSVLRGLLSIKPHPSNTWYVTVHLGVSCFGGYPFFCRFKGKTKEKPPCPTRKAHVHIGTKHEPRFHASIQAIHHELLLENGNSVTFGPVRRFLGASRFEGYPKNEWFSCWLPVRVRPTKKGGCLQSRHTRAFPHHSSLLRSVLWLLFPSTLLRTTNPTGCLQHPASWRTWDVEYGKKEGGLPSNFAIRKTRGPSGERRDHPWPLPSARERVPGNGQRATQVRRGCKKQSHRLSTHALPSLQQSWKWTGESNYDSIFPLAGT